MYSPFKDAHGRPKGLWDISYEDLLQLADLDEGFVLEFKRAWNASVRKKVPKIIASFANTSGGWLVIGVADDDRAVCPVPRGSADYSQVIGELCRRHVSPAPRFDVRFIACPHDPDYGVVVVQVFEGDFPPYVADGVVEVREGSTSGPAMGTSLVELYHKATRRRLEVSDFCRRTVWYPTDTGCPSCHEDVPLFSLYLFRMGPRAGDEVPTRDDIADHVQAMRSAFARQGMDCHVQHAHDSLVVRASRTAPGGAAHSAIELFPNESMKLTVPAIMVEGPERAQAMKRLGEAGVELPDHARLIGAGDTLGRVTRMATVLDRYVRSRKIPWSNYAVAYELEGMAGATLWSPDEVYLDYVRGHGALFCATTDCRSRIRYLDDGSHDSFRARQFAGSHFFEACGLPLGSHGEEDNRLVDALLRG